MLYTIYGHLAKVYVKRYQSEINLCGFIIAVQL